MFFIAATFLLCQDVNVFYLLETFVENSIEN